MTHNCNNISVLWTRNLTLKLKKYILEEIAIKSRIIWQGSEYYREAGLLYSIQVQSLE